MDNRKDMDILEEYMDMVRGIFPIFWPGKDGKSVELNFEED